MTDPSNPPPHDREGMAPKPLPGAITPDDPGSQALAEALRSSLVIVRVIIAALVVVFFWSGCFTVQPQEKAVVLRFGKPVGQGDRALRGPGFHWAFPAPIDEVVRIPVNQIRAATSTVGWYATTPEMEATKTEPPPGPSLNPAQDGYTLTGDANIIHVRATLRYRITDPLRYQFGFENPDQFVTNALDNALFYASARFSVDDVLTRNVSLFRETVAARVNQLIEQQGLGVTVEPSDVQAIPPRQLRDKFNAVLETSVKRDQALNEARSYETEVLNRAKSDAAARVNAGETDRTRLIAFIGAEAKTFSELLPKYRDDPELFMRLRQSESLARVLTNAQRKLALPSGANGKRHEIRLQLGPEPPKPKAAEPANVDKH